MPLPLTLFAVRNLPFSTYRPSVLPLKRNFKNYPKAGDARNQITRWQEPPLLLASWKEQLPSKNTKGGRPWSIYRQVLKSGQGNSLRVCSYCYQGIYSSADVCCWGNRILQGQRTAMLHNSGVKNITLYPFQGPKDSSILYGTIWSLPGLKGGYVIGMLKRLRLFMDLQDGGYQPASAYIYSPGKRT